VIKGSERKYFFDKMDIEITYHDMPQCRQQQ